MVSDSSLRFGQDQHPMQKVSKRLLFDVKGFSSALRVPSFVIVLFVI
jgi:hypothetical protein